MRVCFLVIAVTLMSALPAWASDAGRTYLGIPNSVWLPVNLAAFLFFLYWFVGRPMGRFFDQRAEGISADLRAAEAKLVEAEELRSQVLNRVEEVEKEVAELRERAEREGAAEAERIAEQAQRESERFMLRVTDEIARRQTEIRNQLAQETVALTAEMARELLSREMDESDRRRVFERSLSAMDAVAGKE